MICKCKSKAFYLHIIYKHDIPLKLTFAKGMILSKSDSSYISNKLQKSSYLLFRVLGSFPFATLSICTNFP